MTAALTMVVIRLILHPRTMQLRHLGAWGAILVCATFTSFLGWRETRSQQGHLSRIHRAAGLITLVGLALTMGYWLLRARS